jgi:flagellar biogenesis protein FliO
VPLPPASASLAEPAKPTATFPASDESRLLAPRSKPAQFSANADASFSDGLKSRLPSSFSKMDSLTTAGAGLAIVVGLFFVCMWLLRRTSGSKPGGLLPNEAFAVLGRAPLTPQSFAQLLRVGNKLVLVAVSADGIQPLTEVIDPLEVDRLAGVCASGRGHGPAAEFQQVLAQLAKEPARGFLGAEAASGGGRRRA